MTISQVTVTGNILPPDSDAVDGLVRFILTGNDIEDATDTLVARRIVEVALTDGAFTVDLWPTSAGEYGQSYQVELQLPSQEQYVKDKWVRIGEFQLPATPSTQDLTELLDASGVVLPVPNTLLQVLLDARDQAVAAATAAGDSETAAASSESAASASATAAGNSATAAASSASAASDSEDAAIAAAASAEEFATSRSYATIVALEAVIADGATWPEGSIVTANGRQFIWETGYISASGTLDGLRPVKPRVAVIGDSLSLIAPGRSYPWPKGLQDQFSQVGVDCEIVTYAVGGATFGTALNNFWRDKDGNNADQIDKVGLSDCDAVLVCLGYNNAFTISSTIGEAQDEIDAFLTALKSSTNAPIYFIRQYVWDRRVITPDGTETAIPNRLVIPQLHELIGSGTPSGSGGSDRVSNHPLYFDNDIGATARAKCYVLQQINDYLVSTASGDAQLGTVGELDMFTTARMGCHTDGLHLDEIGHRLQAANLLLPVIAALPELFDAAYNSKYTDSEIYSMDAVFDAIFIGVDYGNDAGNFYDPDRVIGGFGRDYIVSSNNPSAGNGQTLLAYHNYNWRQRQDTWHISLFRDIVCTLPTVVHDASTPMVFSLQNMPATDTITLWNPNAGTWQATRVVGYNGKSTAGGFNTSGNLNYAISLEQLYGVTPAPGATDTYNGDPLDPSVPPLDIGIRLQSSTWPEGYAFIEFWGKLTVLNDLP